MGRTEKVRPFFLRNIRSASDTVESKAMLKPIEWTGHAVRLLDQTKLPTQTVYLDIEDERQMWDAIRRLVVRGAPAIGISAAFGVYLGVKQHRDEDVVAFMKRLREVCDYLSTSRPTAVNLFWAVKRIYRVAEEVRGHTHTSSPVCHVVRDILDAILDECLRMIEEDHRVCRAIGEHGLKLLEQTTDRPLEILTHCNAGGLATAGYGTALAPIYLGKEKGFSFHVFADETRPLLQGSRITAYELKENGVPVTVICDGMAATVMNRQKIDAIFVGADRIAANGDTANKIGTHQLAILARHFNIPFYVAAPISTIDLETADGAAIPIEERSREEVTSFGEKPTAPEDVDVFNPAFDVTPAELITGIVTENGVAKPPFTTSLKRLCKAPTASP
ncbi:MAG TPA: S-methyl-5-thioribose-1-phosphate isomerase [Tepidisphaeraceae bacterium]|jgi:methylthioribose-1-phosphate isomerase